MRSVKGREAAELAGHSVATRELVYDDDYTLKNALAFLTLRDIERSPDDQKYEISRLSDAGMPFFDSSDDEDDESDEGSVAEKSDEERKSVLAHDHQLRSKREPLRGSGWCFDCCFETHFQHTQ